MFWVLDRFDRSVDPTRANFWDNQEWAAEFAFPHAHQFERAAAHGAQPSNPAPGQDHEDAAALDALVFAPVQETRSVHVPDMNISIHHNDALEYGPSMVSSAVPHHDYAPKALFTPPHLRDVF